MINTVLLRFITGRTKDRRKPVISCKTIRLHKLWKTCAIKKQRLRSSSLYK